MEIGDIFVVNKADREGADRVVQGVASNLSLKTYDPPNGSRQFSRPKPRLVPVSMSCGRRVAGSENGRASIGSRAGGNGTCRGFAMSWRYRSCATSTERCLQRSSIAMSRPSPAGPAIHTQWLKRS